MIKPVVSRVDPTSSSSNPRSSLRVAAMKALAGIAILCGAHQAAATPVATTTTLAVTSSSSVVTTVSSGTVVTLTATVLAGTAPITVGQVNFCNAAATHCTGGNLLATAQLTSAGTAKFKFRPGVGSHSYSAVFLGTPHGAAAYASSASSSAPLTVTGLWPSITTLRASASGNTSKLTATVGGNDSTAPTGTVSFLNTTNGNAVLDTATLGAGTTGPRFLDVTNAELYMETLPNPISIALGDFNGDGIPDLAVLNNPFNTVTIMLGNGDGTFTTKSTPQTGRNSTYVVVGDFDGDGNLDLAVANAFDDSTFTGQGPGTLTVLMGNGDGTFAELAASPAVGALPIQSQ